MDEERCCGTSAILCGIHYSWLDFMLLTVILTGLLLKDWIVCIIFSIILLCSVIITNYMVPAVSGDLNVFQSVGDSETAAL